MYISNIDTLQFSLDFLNYNNIIATFSSELETKKCLAQIYRSDYKSDKVLFELNDFVFEILPNGSKGYSYILHNNDYEIDFASVRSVNISNYPVFIKIKQSSLWALGVKKSYSKILNWISGVFGKPIGEKINRADLCCHTDNINFSSFDYNYFKTRATKKNTRICGSTINGFEFGVRKGLIFCRIYNKSLEIKEKRNKCWFLDIWKSYNADITNVWNVEFELKRNFLREYGIETVKDLLEKSKAIWEYLTQQWLVLTQNNRSRLENSTVLSEWKILSNCFMDMGSKSFVRKSSQLQADKNSIVAQVCGYIKSYAAIENIYDLQSALELLYADLTIYMNKTNKKFEKLVFEKASLYQEG